MWIPTDVGAYLALSCEIKIPLGMELWGELGTFNEIITLDISEEDDVIVILK